jgi:tripartite-type tricarboxylate transporter receptor subunit TctC
MEAMRSMRFGVAAVGIAAALLFGPQPSLGQPQSWPQRTVRFYVPLGPGSGTDIGARLLQDRLAKRWGQPVVIENRPGGDGIVGISAFVNAKDDHILLFAPPSAFTAHPYLHDNVPYRPEDLAPIARVSNTIIAVSVPATLPVNSLDELIKLARAEPGKMNWAGVTGALDFMFESYLKSTGLQMSKVPYRNAVDAANDLAEGRIQVYRSAYAIIRPRVDAGKAKVLAVSNSARSAAAPDIPTVAEAGYPELTIDGLVGLFGPPSMSMELRERLAADVKAVMDADPAIAERLTLTGQFVNPGRPAEFGASIDAQRATLAIAARHLGVVAKQ